MCVIHRRRHELAVVPAKAGTHSHQCSSLSDAVATAFFDYSTPVVMGPGLRRDDTVGVASSMRPGDPVRRGPSVHPRTSLEYWITRMRG
ncbi:hypothetical protein ACVIGB_003686 [Bradyrhizobium sp. USDA 4341]